MSIFKELKDAAEMAHHAGDYKHAQALDNICSTLGEIHRFHNEFMSRETMATYVAIWTQACVLLGDKPKAAA